jgi:transcriptional regulator with GAF, ATPase, and Fis domain
VKLELPVWRVGILAIAFETDISVFLGSQESTEMLVDVLALHCLRLGQLLATANRCRAAHHRKISTDKSVDSSPRDQRETNTEIPLSNPARHTPPPQRVTEVSVSQRVTEISLSHENTDISVNSSGTEIPVDTIETALVRCISTALDQARGKIYGRGGAAELLGLKPSTLQSKMRKIGLERTDFSH